jgi:hypothetical protein
MIIPRVPVHFLQELGGIHEVFLSVVRIGYALRHFRDSPDNANIKRFLWRECLRVNELRRVVNSTDYIQRG